MNKVEEKILEKNIKKYILQKDGEAKVNSNLVKYDARNLDSELLEFLFSEFKNEYFKMLKDGVWVFDKERFLDYISSKNFLSDSYTAFSNKISLCDTLGDSIAQKTEVVLNFPFKDCVLEGGASKDSDKKKEIFFNQTLASEDIDRLFSPKVLHHFSYISEESGKLSEQNDITKIPTSRENSILTPPPLRF
ncbi:hypothetical protein BKH42_00405 [Helicobacter sp. 13S00482-2]|uniref:site-specific DNA-methyltransferase n=1 Tax=Helicobacter sp. 13S00482-2 TaxID=1476200 RepID=UPI000BA6F3EC|nr:site-specific DNA-methyltransferase [Helicobacter sp. 13S00482-2]PAF54413.1 hypothetical protein BKH42_00405 [Helicobacter sp. 13S00482-2]